MNNTTPQPAATAPKDGTTILTENGFVYWSPRRNSWYCCSPDGSGHRIARFVCADDGEFDGSGFEWWTPMPDWIAKLNWWKDWRRKLLK